jgi:hypothetical protein
MLPKDKMWNGCGMRRVVFFMFRCEAYWGVKNTEAEERRTNDAKRYDDDSPKT